MMERLLEQHRKTWDRLHLKGYPGYTEYPRVHELLVNLPVGWLDTKKVLLDIGCGKGFWMEIISSMVSEVHGVDISPEAIRLAEKRLEGLDNTHLYVTKGNALAMFGENRFDLIYSVATFQHIPRKATFDYLVESKRVLKAGGLLVFQVITRWNPELNQGDIGFIKREETIGYTDRQLTDLVSKSGLSVVSLRLQRLRGRASERCGWYWVVCRK